MDDDIELNIDGGDIDLGWDNSGGRGRETEVAAVGQKRQRRTFNRSKFRESQVRRGKAKPSAKAQRNRKTSAPTAAKQVNGSDDRDRNRQGNAPPAERRTVPAAKVAGEGGKNKRDHPAQRTHLRNADRSVATKKAADKREQKNDTRTKAEAETEAGPGAAVAPKELPRIYSHHQATTAKSSLKSGEKVEVKEKKKNAEGGHVAFNEDEEEINSDIDEEGKSFIDQFVSKHFKALEEEEKAAAQEEVKPVEPLNSNAENFSELGLDQVIVNCLLGMGYEAPTSIQKSAMPILLSGKDVLAQSPTGSGKTIAYVAPILQLLKQRPVRVNRAEGALAIIIVPTRELSLQVFQVASRLFKDFYWIVPGVIMGGEKRSREKARLRKGINVLVCTPGRLLDHLENTTAFQVSDLKYLILDEADRLIDMGFEEQVSKIIQLLDQRAEMGDRSDKVRQTVMLSATMHSGVSKLAKFSLHDPVSIGFDMNQSALEKQGEDTSFQMPKQLKQYYILVPTKLRPVILYKLVRKSFMGNEKNRKEAGGGKCKMVIFVSCCDSVEFHYEILNELSAFDEDGSVFNSEDTIFKLHGNMTQQERTKVYFDFCKSSSAILLCTDVAARGLDFPLVTHIIQYDPPGEAEDYIHRVGRTARMQSKGEAHLFLLPTEMPYIDILRDKGIQLQEDYVGQFLHEDSNLLLLKGKVNALFRDPVFQKFQRLIFDIVSDSKAIHQLAADAYRSFLRAYARYPSAIKTIFNVKALHIGHVADSFGLREKPSMIGKSTTAQEFKKRKNEQAKSFVRRKKPPRQIFLSE